MIQMQTSYLLMVYTATQYPWSWSFCVNSAVFRGIRRGEQEKIARGSSDVRGGGGRRGGGTERAVKLSTTSSIT